MTTTTKPSLDPYLFDPMGPSTPVNAYFEGLLSEEDLTIWLGREKHRKTNIILQLAFCAALGRPFLGFKFAAPRPLRVVVLDYETKTPSLKIRYDALAAAMALNDGEREMLRENLRILEIRKLLRAGKPFPRIPIITSKPKQAEDDDLNFWRGLAREFSADLIVFDPMRSIHAGDENDSMIEGLLGTIRQLFGRSAVIVAHHMRKVHGAGGKEVTLEGDMRLWSDGARGSSAIKAHADVIVCQERLIDENHTEVVFLGGFLKDGPDIEPLRLEESDAQSFFWVLTNEVPSHLVATFEVLKQQSKKFPDSKAIVDYLMANGTKRATAYRHVTEFRRRNLLVEDGGGWRVSRDTSLRVLSNTEFHSSRRRMAED